MVLIFGWGAGQAQDFGEVAPTTCPVCHNEVFLHHVKSDKSFSLYFIPLATLRLGRVPRLPDLPQRAPA